MQCYKVSFSLTDINSYLSGVVLAKIYIWFCGDKLILVLCVVNRLIKHYIMDVFISIVSEILF